MRHIDMPMVMGTKRLHEAGALGAVFSVPLLEQTSLGQDPPGAARADGNDIPVKHHERQPPVAFQGMIERKPDNGLPLPGLQSEITRNQTIMFVCLAVTGCPRVELAPRHPQPSDYPVQRNFRSGGPLAAEINHRIAGVMGNPAAIQSSPSSFFNWICSSSNSESTSCFRRSFSSSSPIRRSWPCSLPFPSGANTDAPCSKNCLCQP